MRFRIFAALLLFATAAIGVAVSQPPRFNSICSYTVFPNTSAVTIKFPLRSVIECRSRLACMMGKPTMRIALQTPIAASRKEPLVEMAARVRKAFLDVRLGEPFVRFSLTDTPGPKGVSAIDRVLKRYPEMERFLTNRKLGNGLTGARILSNALSDEPAD